jgi:hypothetical protein
MKIHSSEGCTILVQSNSVDVMKMMNHIKTELESCMSSCYNRYSDSAPHHHSCNDNCARITRGSLQTFCKTLDSMVTPNQKN